MTHALYRAHPSSPTDSFSEPLQAVFIHPRSPLFSKQGLSVQQKMNYFCFSTRFRVRLY